MNERKCETCRFWDQAEESESGGDEFGYCRRHAPRPERSKPNIAFWPETLADEWCGEHRPRPDEDGG